MVLSYDADAVITAVPAPLAVTTPFWSTDATEIFDDDHITPFKSSETLTGLTVACNVFV